MMDQRAQLVAQLIAHEGLRLKAYLDTVGKVTIGVGRNLSDRPITREQALAWLDEDIDNAIVELTTAFGWFAELDPVRQRVLIDMHINLGLPRLLMFKKMLAAIGRKDYAAAAEEMRLSRWARQVGRRAATLSEMMASGEAEER